MKLAQILKILALVAAFGSTAGGLLDGINPKIGGVVAVTVATILAFTKAVHDNGLDSSVEPKQ